MTYKTREIARALESKGFREKSGSHRYYFLYVDGRKTRIHTKLSHGVREYGDTLLSRIAEQLKLTRGELAELIECPLDYQGYVSLLRKNGHLA